MNTKWFAALLFVGILSCAAHPAYAGPDFGKGPGQKFLRGLFYLAASPFQVPKEIIQTAAETKPHYFAPFRGMTAGVGSGAYQMGRQIVAGFADLFTFWSPRGRDWQPIYEPASLLPEM
jgi:hypothetical protein